ncbi:MAG: hypothetical protein JXQ30_09060 [Spirochaetes bacterium]|nr:hypothetical protein [Spirochaetota bacterium]
MSSPQRKLLRILALFLCINGVLFASSSRSAAGGGGGESDASGSGTKEEQKRPSAGISSAFIGVEVDMETGRLHLFVAEKKGKKDLLFFDAPPSSFFMIYTNGDAFVFGDNTGEFVTRPEVVNGGIESVWRNDLISVKERFELVRRKDTKNADGVLITCTVENRLAYAAEVGMEAVFDTYLGEKTLVHFEISGGTPVEYETVFEKEQLPQRFFSAGSKDDPLCLMGVVKGGLVTAPDKLIFANYRALSDSRFGYRVTRKKRFDLLPYSRNDSAAALLFLPVSVEPGESRTFTMILGICGTGEFETADAAALEGQEPFVPERPAEEKPVSPPLIGQDVDLERLNGILREIRVSRESIRRINEYINRLNGMLDKHAGPFEGEALTEKELEALQSALRALEH